MTATTQAPAVTPAGDRLRPRWTSLASLGLALAAAGPLLMLLAAVAWGLDTDDAAYFAVTAAIPLVAGLLVRRFGTWAKAVGIVGGLAAGMGLFWTAFGLLAGPASFFDFVPGVLVVPGALLAIVSCIAAIVAKRRGNLGVAPIGKERSAIRVVVGIVVLALVTSGAWNLFGRSTVPEAAAARAAATSTMKDFEFAPASYTVAGGSTILVRNDDPFAHSFTVDALGIDTFVSAGSSALITIPAKPGTYVLYCQPHTGGDKENPTPDDMAGTLTVM